MNKVTYTGKEVQAILGFSPTKITRLCKEGKIVKAGRDSYLMGSVDSYRAEMDERLSIEPAKFLQRGNLT